MPMIRIYVHTQYALSSSEGEMRSEEVNILNLNIFSLKLTQLS